MGGLKVGQYSELGCSKLVYMIRSGERYGTVVGSLQMDL